MKLDPYNQKEIYERWKSNPYNSNVSKVNNQIIKTYIFDMEKGKNISRHSPKGARSHIRLNKLRQKIFFIAELLEKNYKIKDITEVTEDNMLSLFSKMRDGRIKKLDGGVYKSTGDYVKVFKAFYHWFMKSSKKPIKDITEDLDTSVEIPKFNYFSEDQLNDLLRVADEDMKVLMLFLMDTGIRVTEMKNIKVSDFLKDFTELNIREETSKTFGRRIKLMMCKDVIKKYISIRDLKEDNFIFHLDIKVMNNRLNKIGEKILGVKNLTLYDFRHSSACYWYPRYPNVQGLLYRFGWKKLEMAHYYAQYLGMEDTITEESLLLGVTKTELEKEMELVKRQMQQMKTQMTKMFKEKYERDGAVLTPLEY